MLFRGKTLSRLFAIPCLGNFWLYYYRKTGIIVEDLSSKYDDYQMALGFSTLNNLLNRFGYHVTCSHDPRYVHVQKRFLESALESFEVIAQALVCKAGLKTFIQIGANDGVHDDGLRPLIADHKLQGILVEPQPHAAELLRERYRTNSNVKVAEVAVASENGVLQLWRVSEVTLIGKLKMDAVTSFDRDSLSVKLKRWGVKAELEPFSVKAMSLQGILEEYQIESPDIVMIDTEGMDRIVLDQVQLSESGPALIQFEINNLNSRDLEYCRQRLVGVGYRFILTERDVICIHPAYLRYLVGEGAL